MRKPFTNHNTEYEQAKQDYERVIAPDILEDILERSLEQYADTPVSFALLVDMKVMRIIQDDIERLTNDIN